MADTLVTATIAGTASILAAAITAAVPTLISRLDDRKRFLAVATLTDIQGYWKGSGEDSFVGGPAEKVSFDLKLHLTIKKNKISGVADLEGT